MLDPLKCSECRADMLFGAVGLVCPNGHGRIVHIDPERLDDLKKRHPDRVIQPSTKSPHVTFMNRLLNSHRPDPK